MDEINLDLSASDTGLSEEQIKEFGAVYTPNSLIQKMYNSLDIDWKNPPQDKIFLDPTCGNGQFLVELARRGIPLKNIYGVDLMPDNINTTKNRLREYFNNKMNEIDIEYHLERNIICDDALTYHYQFWWYEPEPEIVEEEW